MVMKMNKPSAYESNLQQVNMRVAISSQCNLRCEYCRGTDGYSQMNAAMEDFRKKPLREGFVQLEELIGIMRIFRDEGLSGVTLTGGEPLLNPEWDMIVSKLAEIGMCRVEITTNGTMLSGYLDKKGKLPDGLTLLKVSLDTFDPDRFRNMTRGGDIYGILDALRFASSHIRIRANRVLLRSRMDDLVSYLETCEATGIQEVNLLDLVMYPNRSSLDEMCYFGREYIPFSEIRDYLGKQTGLEFSDINRYGHEASSAGGLKVIVKDSRYTRRDAQCSDCPIFCQEGKYTIRIGSDGNITTCPDYRNELPSIDGPSELRRGDLVIRVHELLTLFRQAEEVYTINQFFRRHKIKLVGND